MELARRALVLGACTVATLSFAGDADFTLVNGTGHDIRGVYIKLGDRAACKHDMKVVLEKLTLKYDSGTGEVSALKE